MIPGIVQEMKYRIRDRHQFSLLKLSEFERINFHTTVGFVMISRGMEVNLFS